MRDISIYDVRTQNWREREGRETDVDAVSRNNIPDTVMNNRGSLRILYLCRYSECLLVVI